jgi:hypothetical protein
MDYDSYLESAPGGPYDGDHWDRGEEVDPDTLAATREDERAEMRDLDD